MRVLIIGDSSELYMPYLENYKKAINHNCTVKVLNWDRFQIDSNNKLRYRDFKIGHKRNIVDYYKFGKFIIKILEQHKFDKLVIFGLPILVFIGKYIQKKYTSNYLIDIRDYHKSIKFKHVKSTILNSSKTIISSPFYKSWLPEGENYICNHNTNIKFIDDIQNRYLLDLTDIKIGSIGATRDLNANVKLINCLQNNDKFSITFHGLGDVNASILDHIKKHNIKNVIMTGVYKKKDEKELYLSKTLISVVRYNDSLNNATALPNRLYNAAYYGVPMLAYPDTCLSTIIQKFNLGIVIQNINNIESEILEYLSNFDYTQYLEGRKNFLSLMIKDNNSFNEYLSLDTN
jgi:hypothetical protein